MTSFGYLEVPSENQSYLRSFARYLCNGLPWFCDYYDYLDATINLSDRVEWYFENL
jgi:hypothetical protein